METAAGERYHYSTAIAILLFTPATAICYLLSPLYCYLPPTAATYQVAAEALTSTSRSLLLLLLLPPTTPTPGGKKSRSLPLYYYYYCPLLPATATYQVSGSGTDRWRWCCDRCAVKNSAFAAASCCR